MEPSEDDGSPAARLRSRAGGTDRAARFDERLREVEARRARDRSRRRVLGWLAVLAGAGLGALSPVVAAAVTLGAEPSGAVILAAAAVGLVLAVLARIVAGLLARRRGASAWDWHHERYVLIGNPSLDVREADRPGGGPSHSGPFGA